MAPRLKLELEKLHYPNPPEHTPPARTPTLSTEAEREGLDLFMEDLFYMIKPSLEGVHLADLCSTLRDALPCSDLWWSTFQAATVCIHNEEPSLTHLEILGVLENILEESEGFPAWPQSKLKEIQSAIENCSKNKNSCSNPTKCEKLWSVIHVLPSVRELQRVTNLLSVVPVTELFLVIGECIVSGHDSYKCAPLVTSLVEEGKFELSYSTSTGKPPDIYVAKKSRGVEEVEGSWEEARPGMQSPLFTCNPCWVESGDNVIDTVNWSVRRTAQNGSRKRHRKN